MAGWRFFYKTDRSVDRIGYWAGVFGPGGLLATLMTWAASAFEPIARYGWGGIVIAGAVLGCFVVLTIAAGLIAWRQFNPLPASPGSTNALSNEASISEGHAVSGQIQKLQERLEGLTRAMGESERAKNQTFEGFQAELSELKNRLSKIDDSLRPKQMGLLALGSGQNYETRLDAIEAMVQGARDSIKGTVDGLLHTMD
ncbi:hypothetical protein BB934_04900 [Microvirga ossetica]|uniref:Uncharacterized protein n=1 Tax=Microvirga ossetica TaxID=1882682 RepID=A0A1B2ECP8_9HYPH|nr:hypothetical protein [Microvirga ossetica]ANY77652.1 hypothetical protein BB934_04900 [Microvirga ossetica]